MTKRERDYDNEDNDRTELQATIESVIHRFQNKVVTIHVLFHEVHRQQQQQQQMWTLSVEQLRVYQSALAAECSFASAVSNHPLEECMKLVDRAIALSS